jgi:hypothetical protein
MNFFPSFFKVFVILPSRIALPADVSLLRGLATLGVVFSVVDGTSIAG